MLIKDYDKRSSLFMKCVNDKLKVFMTMANKDHYDLCKLLWNKFYNISQENGICYLHS